MKSSAFAADLHAIKALIEARNHTAETLHEANRLRIGEFGFAVSHITNGFSGLAAGFPLAIYLFIGWENSAALAEETGNPRRNVPRAVYLSIAMMVVGYVLFAFATVTGFHYNGTTLAASSIPFITVAHNVLAGFAFFAYLAGLTSTIGVLISAVNSQARLIFNAGREGLLPRWIGKVHPNRKTPMNAIYVVRRDRQGHHRVWALLHLHRRPQEQRQHGRDELLRRVLDHGHDPGAGRLLPGQPGAAVLLPQVPAARVQRGQARSCCRCSAWSRSACRSTTWCKPGQSAPYDWFPYAALAIVVAGRRLRLHPEPPSTPASASRAGSIVADEWPDD